MAKKSLEDQATELGYDLNKTVYRLTITDVLSAMDKHKRLTKMRLDAAIEAVETMDSSQIFEILSYLVD